MTILKSPGSQHVSTLCLFYESHSIVQLWKSDALISNACQKTRNSFLFKNIAFVLTHFFPLELPGTKLSFSLSAAYSLEFSNMQSQPFATWLLVGQYCTRRRTLVLEGLCILGVQVLSTVIAHIPADSKLLPFWLPSLCQTGA